MSHTVCYGRLSTHAGKAYNAPDNSAVGAVFPVFASEQTRTSLCSRFPKTQACPPARARSGCWLPETDTGEPAAGADAGQDLCARGSTGRRLPVSGGDTTFSVSWLPVWWHLAEKSNIPGDFLRDIQCANPYSYCGI